MFDWVSRNKLAISLVASITTLACTVGITLLTITPDNRIFYGKDNQYFVDFQQFEQDYSSNNNILFVVSAGFPVYEANYARAIRWLTRHAWQISNVTRVDSLATYPHPSATGDDIEVAPILDTICPPNEACSQLAPTILDRPELVNRLISPDQQSTGILATLFLEIGTVGEIERINQQAQSIADLFETQFPGYQIVFTGGVPMMAAFAEASAADLSKLLPIAILTMAVFLLAFLGGIQATIVIFLLGAAAAGATLGIAGWSGHTINNATSIVPVIVLTLVIASSMHVALHFQRSSGDTKDPEIIAAAAKAALENNLPPLSISAATSIVGLLSLSLVDSPPLQQLGQLSALGVAIGYALTITVLPIALSLRQTGMSSKSSSVVQQRLNTYARKIEDRQSYFILGSVISLALIAGIPNLVIDDNFVDYFDRSTQFRIQTDRATELLAGPNHIEVLVRTPNTESGVFEPAYLEYVRALSEFIRSSKQVSNVHSYYDIIDSVIAALAPETTAQVFTADEIAQFFLVYELSLEEGQSNTDFVSSDQTEARISVLLTETSSREIQTLESSIDDFATSLDNTFSVKVTGENIPVAHISEMNISSMVGGLGGSMLLTAILVGFYFRKARLGFTAFIAVLVPVACGFGVWGWIRGEIGLASTAIVALTIGVVVDDAVHLIYRYLDGIRRMNLDPWQAAAHSVHRAGNAVTITSIVMIAGLSVLQFSAFEVNSSFGICTCLIIGLALFFDLFVLPRILVWTGR